MDGYAGNTTLGCYAINQKSSGIATNLQHCRMAKHDALLLGVFQTIAIIWVFGVHFTMASWSENNESILWTIYVISNIYITWVKYFVSVSNNGLWPFRAKIIILTVSGYCYPERCLNVSDISIQICQFWCLEIISPLRWRQNNNHGIPSHWPLECFSRCLLRLTSKKTSKSKLW